MQYPSYHINNFFLWIRAQFWVGCLLKQILFNKRATLHLWAKIRTNPKALPIKFPCLIVVSFFRKNRNSNSNVWFFVPLIAETEIVDIVLFGLSWTMPVQLFNLDRLFSKSYDLWFPFYIQPVFAHLHSLVLDNLVKIWHENVIVQRVTLWDAEFLYANPTTSFPSTQLHVPYLGAFIISTFFKQNKSSQHGHCSEFLANHSSQTCWSIWKLWDEAINQMVCKMKKKKRFSPLEGNW